MKLFEIPKTFLGIDIGSYSIKFVEITIEKNQIKLNNLGYSVLNPNVIVNGYIISLNLIIQTIKKLIKRFKIKSKLCAVSIPGNKVIIKRLQLPPSNLENLDEQIQIQASQYIPYEITDVVLDFDILNSNINLEEQENLEILLVATKREIVHDYLQILLESKLTPEFGDVDFFAIQNCIEYNYKEELKGKVLGVLNIGNYFSNLIILNETEALFYREFNVGTEIITKKIEKRLNLSFYEAEKIKLNNSNNSIVKEAREDFFKDILKETSKSIELFKNTSNIDKIDKILLSGGGSMIKGFKQFLGKSFEKVEIDYISPFKNFIYNNNLIDSEYLKYISPVFTISAGLALRGLEID